MALVCTVATTVNLDATYSVINHQPTLTLNATGVLTIDGRDILVGDVILVKDQSSLNQNAVYQCYTRGAMGVAAVLVLYYQFSTLQNINNCGIINIIFGDTNQNTGWVINSTVTAIGVSNISFVNFVDPNGLEHAKFINFVGSTGTNLITFPDNEFESLIISDTSDNPYLVFQSSNSSTTRLNMRLITGCTLRTSGFIEANNGSIVWGTTSYSTGTAALNLTTVTGSGTTFPATCSGGSIYFPNQALYAEIVSRDSATQLTVANTGTTFTADDFIIYYSGTIIDGKGVRQLNNQTLVANNIDTPSTAVGVGTALALGATNATSITLGGKAISLAGNFTTSGAFNSTFTMTADTSVTFPTSGTLATTALLPTLPLSLSNGGTNASLTASNGGIFYSTASAGAILSGTATASQLLLSGATAAPTWSTTTYPSTNAINTLLYASSANVMAALATGNNGVLITSAGGVPSISSTLPSAVQTNITSLGTISTGVWQGTVVGATYGGTGVNNGANTITLAGNLVTSGANSLTFTTTGPTNVTLPTSGTLATTGGTVSSVTGTSNRITSSGGTTPAIDISASYVGQSSITTLGTIVTGTWQGTVVGSTYGGTGVNNGSSTITLGGNLTLSGAFTTTLTVTANTSVTLPTSGTLATTQGIPMTVVSGTSQAAAVNNSYVSNNAGLCTITLPSTAAVSDTVQVGGLGAGGWKVAQNASQLIHLGNTVTTTGTGGSLASTNQYDSITEIRCVVANTTWICYGVIGNITVV